MIRTFVATNNVYCNMGNWSERQEAKKEVREKNKVRREKLAGFF